MARAVGAEGGRGRVGDDELLARDLPALALLEGRARRAPRRDRVAERLERAEPRAPLGEARAAQRAPLVVARDARAREERAHAAALERARVVRVGELLARPLGAAVADEGARPRGPDRAPEQVRVAALGHARDRRAPRLELVLEPRLETDERDRARERRVVGVGAPREPREPRARRVPRLALGDLHEDARELAPPPHAPLDLGLPRREEVGQHAQRPEFDRDAQALGLDAEDLDGRGPRRERDAKPEGARALAPRGERGAEPRGAVAARARAAPPAAHRAARDEAGVEIARARVHARRVLLLEDRDETEALGEDV